MAEEIKDGVGTVARVIGNAFNSVAAQLNKLTAQQAAMFAAGIVLAFVIILQMLASFYESHMPRFVLVLFSFPHFLCWC